MDNQKISNDIKVKPIEESENGGIYSKNNNAVGGRPPVSKRGDSQSSKKDNRTNSTAQKERTQGARKQSNPVSNKAGKEKDAMGVSKGSDMIQGKKIFLSTEQLEGDDDKVLTTQNRKITREKSNSTNNLNSKNIGGDTVVPAKSKKNKQSASRMKENTSKLSESKKLEKVVSKKDTGKKIINEKSIAYDEQSLLSPPTSNDLFDLNVHN